jgi:hypothetical protein
MMDSIQTASDRKALRGLAATLRIGGGALCLTSVWGVLNVVPSSTLETAARTALFAFGLRSMTTMASDCSTAAKHARAPIAYARSCVKLSPLSAAFWLMASHVISQQIPHPAKTPVIERVVPADPLAGATGRDVLKDAEFRKNPDCPYGSSTTTFDEKDRHPIIMECSGPLTFRHGG